MFYFQPAETITSEIDTDGLYAEAITSGILQTVTVQNSGSQSTKKNTEMFVQMHKLTENYGILLTIMDIYVNVLTFTGNYGILWKFTDTYGTLRTFILFQKFTGHFENLRTFTEM